MAKPGDWIAFMSNGEHRIDVVLYAKKDEHYPRSTTYQCCHHAVSEGQILETREAR